MPTITVNISLDEASRVFREIRVLASQASSLDDAALPQKGTPADFDPWSWRPSLGLDTEYQHLLAFMNDHLGLFAVQAVIRRYAEEQAPSSSSTSWQVLLDSIQDYSDHTLVAYLASIDPEAMSFLISGTLASNFYSDQEFQRRVYKDVTPGNDPGVYLVCVCRPPHTPDEGTGPRTTQLREICKHMRRYTDLSDTAFRRIAKEIDGAYYQTNCQDRDYISQRRYTTPKAGHDSIGEWLDTIDEVYLNHAGTPLDQYENEPLAHLSPYIGWGGVTGTAQRANDHKSHKPGESPLFGLYSAVVRYLYGAEFHVETFLVFRCARPEDAGVLEILGSLLTSSYPKLTGLNHALAGGKGKTNAALNDPDTAPVWLRARQAMEDTDNLASHTGIMMNLHDSANRYFDQEREFRRLTAEIAAAKRKLNRQIKPLSAKARTAEALVALERINDGMRAVELDKAGVRQSSATTSSPEMMSSQSSQEL